MSRQTKKKEVASFERKMDKNGNPNPKYVDLLEEDKPIAGQKFVCVSFVSPEKILKKKEIFFFESFLKKWEFNKSMEKFTQFLNFLSFKYKLTFDDVIADFKDFLQEEKENISASTFEDDYKTFVDNNEEELEKEFGIQNHFQTCTRGLKVRGTYSSMEEAELRCKMLREIDPNHDVFVGPVGLWMPWDPEAYKTGRVEYMEDELNKLMEEKNNNETHSKNAFETRLKETKRKAIEDNIKNAEKSGSSITQTIDEEGNLISVANMNTQEASLKDSENDSISTADIKSELFDGENIVIGQTDNGQSQLVSGPFSKKTK
jgi:hypothetical protein